MERQYCRNGAAIIAIADRVTLRECSRDHVDPKRAAPANSIDRAARGS